jgi:hypothetical protein
VLCTRKKKQNRDGEAARCTELNSNCVRGSVDEDPIKITIVYCLLGHSSGIVACGNADTGSAGTPFFGPVWGARAIQEILKHRDTAVFYPGSGHSKLKALPPARLDTMWMYSAISEAKSHCRVPGQGEDQEAGAWSPYALNARDMNLLGAEPSSLWPWTSFYTDKGSPQWLLNTWHMP